MGQGGKAEPRLTPAGHAFLDLRTEMLGAFGRTMPLVKEPGHKMEGRVTVRAPCNEYSFPFIDFLFEFRKENPSIDVAVLPWSPTDGVDDVLSGDVNLAYIGHASGAPLVRRQDARAGAVLPRASLPPGGGYAEHIERSASSAAAPPAARDTHRPEGRDDGRALELPEEG